MLGGDLSTGGDPHTHSSRVILRGQTTETGAYVDCTGSQSVIQQEQWGIWGW